MGQSGYQDGKYPPAVPRAIATFSLFSTAPVAIGLGMMLAGGGLGPASMRSVAVKKPVLMVVNGAEGKVEGPVAKGTDEVVRVKGAGFVPDGVSLELSAIAGLKESLRSLRGDQLDEERAVEKPVEKEAEPVWRRRVVDLKAIRPVGAVARLASAARAVLEDRLATVMEADVVALRQGLAKVKLNGQRLGRMEGGVVLETAEFDGRPLRAKKWMRMRVTAYSPDERSCGKWADGYTASGKSVNTNRMKLVAADTRLLPFGTLITVPGYDGGRPVPVLDRGGAIKGHRLDVLYPTHEEALEWGVQYLDVTVWEYADPGNPGTSRVISP